MKYVVGLGNPEKAYVGTRHNIGFEIVKTASVRWAGLKGVRCESWKTDRWLDARVCAYENLQFIQPLTYMNRSGKAVREMMTRRGAALEEILVVCDDVNLMFGKLRLRLSGSSGGHHGLESIRVETGGQNFPRLRFGVGRPDMPKDLTDFVLGAFEPDEKSRLEALTENAADICMTWSDEGSDAAMEKLGKLNAKSKE